MVISINPLSQKNIVILVDFKYTYIHIISLNNTYNFHIYPKNESTEKTMSSIIQYLFIIKNCTFSISSLLI